MKPNLHGIPEESCKFCTTAGKCNQFSDGIIYKLGEQKISNLQNKRLVFFNHALNTECDVPDIPEKQHRCRVELDHIFMIRGQ